MCIRDRVYTMIMIPYNTLPVEMTKDFNQRTYLTGSKAMFGKVANFLAAAIPEMCIRDSCGVNQPYARVLSVFISASGRFLHS